MPATDQRPPDPVDRIEWRSAEELTANAYNPNMVHNRELRSLELSLLENGWVQPLLVSPAGEVIDGFHRWRLAQDSKRLRERYAGRVPVAVMDLDRPRAMMLTVRMNRAKGTHVAVRMNGLVKELLDEHGLAREEVAQGIGASLAEVDLLYQEDVFKARNIAEYRYGNAWEPRDTGLHGVTSRDGARTSRTDR